MWHGNIFKALQKLESLEFILDFSAERANSKEYKLWKAINELYGYIKINSQFIPTRGKRYRYGECISTAFVESTVNEVISKRRIKQEKMRWTKKGTHLLLQVRIKTLNQELRPTFEKWYPNMKQEDRPPLPLAA